MMRYMLYPRVLAAGAVLAVAAYVAAYLHLAAVPSVPGSGWVRNWLIAWLIVGIYAGALAGTVTQEAGYDLVGDIITGIIGALIGGLVGLAPGWHTFVDVILKAFIGACLLSGLKIALAASRGTHQTMVRPGLWPAQGESWPVVSRAPRATRGLGRAPARFTIQ